jgi:hypothetical protein
MTRAALIVPRILRGHFALGLILSQRPKVDPCGHGAAHSQGIMGAGARQGALSSAEPPRASRPCRCLRNLPPAQTRIGMIQVLHHGENTTEGWQKGATHHEL